MNKKQSVHIVALLHLTWTALTVLSLKPLPKILPSELFSQNICISFSLFLTQKKIQIPHYFSIKIVLRLIVGSAQKVSKANSFLFKNLEFTANNTETF